MNCYSSVKVCPRRRTKGTWARKMGRKLNIRVAELLNRWKFHSPQLICEIVLEEPEFVRMSLRHLHFFHLFKHSRSTNALYCYVDRALEPATLYGNMSSRFSWAFFLRATVPSEFRISALLKLSCFAQFNVLKA